VTLPPLYAVLDDETAVRQGWTLPSLAAACLAGGARLLQVRAKTLASGALLDACEAVVRESAPAGAIVIVNDRPDAAVLAGAAGVHVGQEDLPPAAVRRLVGAGAIVGLSTHTLPLLEAALGEPISYVAIGPVFPTATKATDYGPVGLALVEDAARRVRASVPALPLVAIGGITLETAPAVLAAGATSVAVISDLFVGGHPEARVRAYVARLEGR
jgi:thiamine-phosphate pyrophosphorylase